VTLGPLRLPDAEATEAAAEEAAEEEAEEADEEEGCVCNRAEAATDAKDRGLLRLGVGVAMGVGRVSGIPSGLLDDTAEETEPEEEARGGKAEKEA